MYLELHTTKVVGGIVPTKLFSTYVLFPNPSPFLIKKFIKVPTGVSICLTSYFFSSSSSPPPVHIWRVFSYKISDSAPASRPKLLWNTTLGYICWHVFLTWSRKLLCPFLSIYTNQEAIFMYICT